MSCSCYLSVLRWSPAAFREAFFPDALRPGRRGLVSVRTARLPSQHLLVLPLPADSELLLNPLGHGTAVDRLQSRCQGFDTPRAQQHRQPQNVATDLLPATPLQV